VKRHDLDVVSLVFGLVFGAVACWWGVDRVGRLDMPLGWPLAVALLVAGVVGLLGALPRRPRGDGAQTRIDDLDGTAGR
jgi:hypothetical protein